MERSSQFQMDVFGEVAAALSRMPEAEDDIRVPATEVQAALVESPLRSVASAGPGHLGGARGAQAFCALEGDGVGGAGPRDRVESKCEEERDRGSGGSGSGREAMEAVRATIHEEVCAKGFDKKLNSFVQFYGAKTLDASCLRIALVGFLPASDPRIRGTVEAIEKRLMKNGLVQRYKPRETEDGVAGGEGEFLACSFWMVSNLWLIGRKREAKAMFERLLALRNDVGLLARSMTPAAGRMVGNFPQALSHIRWCMRRLRCRARGSRSCGERHELEAVSATRLHGGTLVRITAWSCDFR